MDYFNDVIMLHMPYGLMVKFFYEMFRFIKSFLYLCNVFNKSSISKWAER